MFSILLGLRRVRQMHSAAYCWHVFIQRIQMFLPRCMLCRRGLAMRILSVCLSNARFVTKWKKHLSRFLYRKRSFSLLFWEEEWFVGCDQFYLKFLVNRFPLERNRRPIFARSASVVTPSEKSSINTKSFPMSLKWSSYSAPKLRKLGPKNAKRPFSF